MCRYILATPPSPADTQHNVRVIYGNGLRPQASKPIITNLLIKICDARFTTVINSFYVVMSKILYVDLIKMILHRHWKGINSRSSISFFNIMSFIIISASRLHRNQLKVELLMG